jgi:Dienelactone hydrolase family
MSPVVVAAMMAAVSLAAEAGQSTDYVVGEKTFEGYRARAQGNSKGLVVIIHDWSGLDDYEKRRADMLSALGYDAFAIDLYGKGNRPDTLEARRREAGQLGQNRALMRRLLLGGLAEGQKMGDAKAVVMALEAERPSSSPAQARQKVSPATPPFTAPSRRLKANPIQRPRRRS